MSGVKRADRVSGRLREELSAAVRGLNDPRIAGVLVSRVEMTDDLQLAKVYVRNALGNADVRAVLKGLEAASNRLRREVASGLKLRYAPTLRFYYDEAPDEVNRIEELLLEVKRDREGQK